MRVNRPWRLDKWLWVPRAMRQMLRYLGEHPEAGMIGGTNWFGRTTVLVSYWRDIDALTSFAGDGTAPHAPAWRRFNRVVGSSGSVGVWHETYLIGPGRAESIYVNMPSEFGLAGALGSAEIGQETTTARRRLGVDGPRGQAAQPVAAQPSGCPVHPVG
jgi:hypothetical protein